jgi:hypothetical protein
MSDQPGAYYPEWAARLNVTPELVADAERIAGKADRGHDRRRL